MRLFHRRTPQERFEAAITKLVERDLRDKVPSLHCVEWSIQCGPEEFTFVVRAVRAIPKIRLPEGITAMQSVEIGNE